MQKVVLYKEPIFVDFDRRRRIEMNLGTEILIRNTGTAGAWEEVGQRVDPDTGETERALVVNEDNLRIYLWAALQDDASARGELLTVEDLRGITEGHNWAEQGVLAIRRALNRYYGGANQTAPKRKRRRSAARSITWEDAFRVVCGEMGYAPAAFYGLLYSELILILEGYRARNERELRRRREDCAWMVSWLLLPHKRIDADPITPDQLLGRKSSRTARPVFDSPGEAAQAFFAKRDAESKKQAVNHGS